MLFIKKEVLQTFNSLGKICLCVSMSFLKGSITLAVQIRSDTYDYVYVHTCGLHSHSSSSSTDTHCRNICVRSFHYTLGFHSINIDDERWKKAKALVVCWPHSRQSHSPSKFNHFVFFFINSFFFIRKKSWREKVGVFTVLFIHSNLLFIQSFAEFHSQPGRRNFAFLLHRIE